ncbi:hypothetical protein Tco_0390221 [Tanacetum coccineum]
MIVALETADRTPRPTFDFTRKMFANMKFKWEGQPIPLTPPMLAIAAAGDDAAGGDDAANEENAAANEAAGSAAEAHLVPPSPPVSPVREPTPETDWVVPHPVSPVADWRPWPSVYVHSPTRDPSPDPASPPTPPAPTFIYEEPLVFGPAPRPVGYVDPAVIEPIIFGPQPRPHGYVDPDFMEPIIFGPQPRPDTYLEPEDLDNIISMEDDTTHDGFHVESPVQPDDAPTPTADAVGRAEDPALLTGLSAKLDRVKKLEKTVKQLRETRLVVDASAAEGDVDIQDDIDLDGLSRMASTALGHDQPAVPSEDVEEQAEEEVPLRRKRSAYRRARTEFSTPVFEQFHANLSAGVLPHTVVTEPAGPSVAADKGKAPMPDLDIPAEFLAEDAQARKCFEEEQASERLAQRLRAEDLGSEKKASDFYCLTTTEEWICWFPRQIRVSPFEDSVADLHRLSHPSAEWTFTVLCSMLKYPNDVLFESLRGVSSISGDGVGLVDKLYHDDEIVDPRVKVETVSESVASPPRSRRKHLGVRSDDFLWAKPVEDFFSSESESDDDMENYIPPLPYGAFQDWEIVSCPLRNSYYHVYYQENRRRRYFRLNPEVNVGLDLWRDVNMLCQSLHHDDVEDFCSISIRATLHLKILRHRLTVSTLFCIVGFELLGNHFRCQAGLRQAYECLASAPLACTARQMVFSSPWLTAKKESGSPLQTALVWFSNPFMVDNLPKIVWYSMHHSIHTEAWLLQSKRLAGKELSNPLMVARLPKTGCPEQTATGKDMSNPLYGCDGLPKTVRVFQFTLDSRSEKLDWFLLHQDWKLLFFDVATSFDSAVHRVHAVSFDAAVLDVAATVSAACIIAAGYIVSAGICDAAVVSAGSSSSVPADYVPAGHVLISADRYRIC